MQKEHGLIGNDILKMNYTKLMNAVKRCLKCKEIKNFKQSKLHSWPKESKPWNNVYVSGVGPLLILVDSFSLWPKVICVPYRSSIVKQVLRVIFSKKRIPKTLVSNNTLEFCDEEVNSCIFNQIG